MSDELARAIRRFRRRRLGQLHGQRASGMCADASEAFLSFCREQGLEAETVWDSAAALGVAPDTRAHCVVKVAGSLVDWTAGQFGCDELPLLLPAAS